MKKNRRPMARRLRRMAANARREEKNPRRAIRLPRVVEDDAQGVPAAGAEMADARGWPGLAGLVAALQVLGVIRRLLDVGPQGLIPAVGDAGEVGV